MASRSYLIALGGDRASGGAAALRIMWRGIHSACPAGGGMKCAARRCKKTPKQTAGLPIMGAALLRSKGVRGLRPASGGTNRLKSVPRTTDAPSTCPRLKAQIRAFAMFFDGLCCRVILRRSRRISRFNRRFLCERSFAPAQDDEPRKWLQLTRRLTPARVVYNVSDALLNNCDKV